MFLKTLVGKEMMWECWLDHLLCCLEASNSWRSYRKVSCLSFDHFCLFSHNSLALWFWCMFHRRSFGAQPTRGLLPREACSSHALRIQRMVCDSDRVRYSATSAACTRPPHRERSDISVITQIGVINIIEVKLQPLIKSWRFQVQTSTPFQLRIRQTGYGLILNIGTASYSDVGATCLVDSVHVFAELWTMAISISVVLSHEEKSMNHLMKKSLWKETLTVTHQEIHCGHIIWKKLKNTIKVRENLNFFLT